MPLPDLIDGLARSGGELRVIQTHISVVFLAGSVVYKIKKPVELGFLDFSTLDKRKHFCEEEVRLNRRLAKSVYLDVVPVTLEHETPQFEGEGEPIEWAVKMRYLPDGASFAGKLEAGRLGEEELRTLGGRLATFHRDADTSDHIASFGRWEIVAGNARENFEQTTPHIGVTVEKSIHDRLSELTESQLSELREVIESRARNHVPRDTHGDLRLEHVYFQDHSGLPNDLVIIDCIEFNERFRFADPVSDVAFLAMDLALHGRRDLRDTLLDAYFQASGDDQGKQLVPFYVAYRAIVRAKVAGIKTQEPEISESDRSEAAQQASAHWLLALGELEVPDRRPCVVILSGLPGTGKSTLARGLSPKANLEVIRTDVVRQELAKTVSSDEDIYTSEWSQRTYDACLAHAAEIVNRGGRVLIDANFRREAQRRQFIDAAIQWGVPAIVLICEVSQDVAKERLQERTDDASDADWETYQELISEWEEPGEDTRSRSHRIDCEGTPEESVQRAVQALRTHELAR